MGMLNLQNIEEIPKVIRELYKTVWEISQKTVLKMAADRGAFIDQSQSLNIHIAEPNYGKLTSMHFYAWKLVCSYVQATKIKCFFKEEIILLWECWFVHLSIDQMFCNLVHLHDFTKIYTQF